MSNKTEKKMRYTLMGDDWGKLDKIIQFGYGRQGQKAFKTLKRDFTVIAIIENDSHKWGSVDGVSIIDFDEARELIKHYKVVVSVSERYYQEIAQQLFSLKLVENRDFTMYKTFFSEWYYRFCNKVCVPKTDIPITSFCSLKCEHCHLFIPYWRKHQHFSVEMLQSTIDQYFNVVDYVVDMDILGGEPFLHPNLETIVDYIGANYREKIGYLGITTNGTIVPAESVLLKMKEHGISVSISDYSDEIGIGSKVNELCIELKRIGICFTRNCNIPWLDLRKPDASTAYPGNKAIEHFLNCNSVYRMIYNKSLYYCGTAWAANMSGLFKGECLGEIRLDSNKINETRKRIIDFSINNKSMDCLSFCSVCGGFGSDNRCSVLTAKQIGGV